MTSFENIDIVELNSLIQTTSVFGLDKLLDNCKINDSAIVIDKDYIKNKIKVRLLKWKKDIWFDTSICFKKEMDL